MKTGRWRRIADLLGDASAGKPVGPAVAEVVAELLGADDVSLTLLVAGEAVSTVGTSATAVALCERQLLLGEGPSVDAVRTGQPQLLDDLDATAAHERMPVLLSDPLLDGVGAIYDPADLPTGITSLDLSASIGFVSTVPVVGIIVEASPPVLYAFATPLLSGTIPVTVLPEDEIDLVFCVRTASTSTGTTGSSTTPEPLVGATASDPTHIATGGGPPDGRCCR